MPQNKLYIRNPDSLISEYELKAIKLKEDKIDKAVKDAQQNKDTKKEEGKKEDGHSTKGDKASKKDGKENEQPKKQQKKGGKSSMNDDLFDGGDVNNERHLKIKLDIMNPSKDKE